MIYWYLKAVKPYIGITIKTLIKSKRIDKATPGAIGHTDEATSDPEYILLLNPRLCHLPPIKENMAKTRGKSLIHMGRFTNVHIHKKNNTGGNLSPINNTLVRNCFGYSLGGLDKKLRCDFPIL
jgi:hypothetical protein